MGMTFVTGKANKGKRKANQSKYTGRCCSERKKRRLAIALPSVDDPLLDAAAIWGWHMVSQSNWSPCVSMMIFNALSMHNWYKTPNTIKRFFSWIESSTIATPIGVSIRMRHSDLSRIPKKCSHKNHQKQETHFKTACFTTWKPEKWKKRRKHGSLFSFWLLIPLPHPTFLPNLCRITHNIRGIPSWNRNQSFPDHTKVDYQPKNHHQRFLPLFVSEPASCRIMIPTTQSPISTTTQRVLLPYLGVWGFNDNVNILLIAILVIAFVVTFITTQLFSLKMRHIEERLLELEGRRKDKKKKSKGAVPRSKMVSPN